MISVLVVDDEEDFLQETETYLTSQGYRVYKATNAEAAKEIVNRLAADISVILLDYALPFVSGIEFLKWLKQTQSFETIQVIMQTGMDHPDNIKEGVEAGAFFYLTKPVAKNLLISTIRVAADESKRQKELYQRLQENENPFRFLAEGTFRFKTVDEGDFLAARIANACSNPNEALFITELFANSVEHGNLQITYDEKTRLIEEGRLELEVRNRMMHDLHRNKFVEVQFKRKQNQIEIEITDQGNGFDFEKYLAFDDNRVFDNHGRGIAITNTYLQLQYLEKGNKVRVTFTL